MLKRLLSMILAVVMVCATFMVVNVNAATSATTEKVTITLFDSDEISPFEKTTGTKDGETIDSNGTTNISGTTTTLAENVRIASGSSTKGASVEMTTELDRANIIKTAADGTQRTTLSFGPTYDNAPKIKDGDVLELSFDYKFGLNANYNANYNDPKELNVNGLVFDTPYRSEVNNIGGLTMGGAWVNAPDSKGIPQVITSWQKVDSTNGTRRFGPSSDLSWGYGLMDADKWYNIKITITDPDDGSDQKITWTYTALEDDDEIEIIENSSVKGTNEFYTVSKTLDMNATEAGRQPLDKATAFGFTFVPNVDEYYDNIKYTLTTSVTKTGCDISKSTVIDLDFDTLDASKFVTKTGINYTSPAIEAGDIGYLMYQNKWVSSADKWSATKVDDDNGGYALKVNDKVNDKSGHTSNVQFLPESEVAISKGDVININLDFTYTDAIRSYFTLMGYTNISLFKIEGKDMWTWKEGAYAKNSIGAFTNKNKSSVYQFNMPNLTGMNDGSKSDYLLVSDRKYNVDITINTNDPECPDTVCGNIIDNKQTIKFVVTDTTTDEVLTWSKAVLDADTSAEEQVDVKTDELAKGKLETVNLITEFKGFYFGQSNEGFASNYESNYVMDNVKVVVTKPGVDAYGENVQGSGDDLYFTPGKVIEVAAIITNQTGNGTNFIIAQYDESGDMINATVYDLNDNDNDYNMTAKFKTDAAAKQVKLFVFNPDNITPMVEALTLSRND